MQSPQGLSKFGKAVAGLGLVGGCATLIGFALIGPFDALEWGASASRDATVDRISYFDEGSVEMSLSEGSVRRLGMSAALEEAAADETAISALAGVPALAGKSNRVADNGGSQTQHAALDPARDPHLQPNPNDLLDIETVAVGDRITVVTPDGLSYVYRVTARQSAAGKDEATLDETKLGTAAPAGDANCKTLGSATADAFRLVIESVKNENGRHGPTEQKL